MLTCRFVNLRPDSGFCINMKQTAALQMTDNKLHILHTKCNIMVPTNCKGSFRVRYHYNHSHITQQSLNAALTSLMTSRASLSALSKWLHKD